MSDLLLRWVNDEIQLSRPVDDLQMDFSSGYLLGEILYRVNQQPTFTKFMDTDSSDAKIHNYILLEPTMRALGIPFEPTTATSIMNQRPNAAATVLYQIKMAIDQRLRMGTVSLRANNEGIQRVQNMSSIPSRPKYDLQKHSFFERTIRLHMKSKMELSKEALDKTAISSDEVVRQRREEAEERVLISKNQRLHEASIAQHSSKVFN